MPADPAGAAALAAPGEPAISDPGRSRATAWCRARFRREALRQAGLAATAPRQRLGLVLRQRSGAVLRQRLGSAPRQWAGAVLGRWFGTAAPGQWFGSAPRRGVRGPPRQRSSAPSWQ